MVLSQFNNNDAKCMAECVSGSRLQIIFSGLLSRFQCFFRIVYKLLPFDSSPFHDMFAGSDLSTVCYPTAR